jgi:hypothetical protein
MQSLLTEINNINSIITMTNDEKINKILEKTQKNSNFKYINKKDVLEWLFKKNHSTKEDEDKWGQLIIGTNKKNTQYTTKLGEGIVGEILEYLQLNPQSKTKKKLADGQNIEPDWIANDGVYECKARTWNTTGTAGEKILGTPYKYIEVPTLYNKPLYIVCLAFQEEEAFNSFKLFGNSKSNAKNQLLKIYKEKFNIEFIKCTDLLLKILY